MRARCRSIELVTLIVLATAVVVGGCGHSTSKASLLDALVPTPGARLTARSGAPVWAVGDPRYAFVSADGGSGWAAVHLPTSATRPPAYRAVAFSDDRHGWAVGDNTIVSTVDGGRTWTAHTEAAGTLYSVACGDATHVWAVGCGGGDQPLVLASSDGGATWREQSVPLRGSLSQVVFVDPMHGWMLGWDAAARPSDYVLATADGGAHWHVVYQCSWPYGLADLTASDARHVWLAGWHDGAVNEASGFILESSDGGLRWNAQLRCSAVPLLGVAFPSARRGWAVGAKGTILATTDGGKSWVAQRSGLTDKALRRVIFSDPTHGWVVVDKWGLLATEDGGDTWTVVLPGGFGRVVWDVAAQ